jgi:hypothetical protein
MSRPLCQPEQCIVLNLWFRCGEMPFDTAEQFTEGRDSGVEDNPGVPPPTDFPALV